MCVCACVRACVCVQEAVDVTVARQGESRLETDAILYNELLGEIRQHWLTARDRVKWFTGRKELLSLVQSYVVSEDDKPLVLHGPHGIGKSAIVAKVAAEVFHRLHRFALTLVFGFVPSHKSASKL